MRYRSDRPLVVDKLRPGPLLKLRAVDIVIDSSAIGNGDT
jgi:hypothetical protein